MFHLVLKVLQPSMRLPGKPKPYAFACSGPARDSHPGATGWRFKGRRAKMFTLGTYKHKQRVWVKCCTKMVAMADVEPQALQVHVALQVAKEF